MPSKLKPKPKVIRHRAGKAPVQEASSSSDSEDGSESEQEETPNKVQPAQAQQTKQITTAPKVTSFPKAAAKATATELEVNEEEFETEDEADIKSEDASSSEAESSSDESSSDSSTASTRRKLLRPVFVKKSNRKAPPSNVASVAATTNTTAQDDSTGLDRRKAETTELIQEQIDRRAAEASASARQWDDDDDVADADMVDDTDGLDPDYEHAAWELRELQRIRRERAAIEESEREIAELERRRNLSAAEREEEDRTFLEGQKAEREGKGPAGYMKKYHHGGAFFQDSDAAKELAGRDLMGASFVDEIKDRSILPKHLQVRDDTQIGRKGRQKHRDLRSEDTGRWGDFGERRGTRGGDWNGDERYRPDYVKEENAESRTGANAGPLGERKRGGETFDDNTIKRTRIDS